MAEKFLGKYRTESLRLKGWDYSEDGAYFITICTKNREPAFGEIKNGKLIETEQSKICESCWLDLPNHYPNCVLDAFVIMPNHVHGVVLIDNWRGGRDGNNVEAIHTVETIHELSLQTRTQIQPRTRKQRRQMMIPKIVGRFKMQVAKQINIFQNTSGQPFWQRDYYDHIVRDEDELSRIREYIWNNPANWRNDENHIS